MVLEVFFSFGRASGSKFLDMAEEGCFFASHFSTCPFQKISVNHLHVYFTLDCSLNEFYFIARFDDLICLHGPYASSAIFANIYISVIHPQVTQRDGLRLVFRVNGRSPKTSTWGGIWTHGLWIIGSLNWATQALPSHVHLGRKVLRDWVFQ